MSRLFRKDKRYNSATEAVPLEVPDSTYIDLADLKQFIRSRTSQSSAEDDQILQMALSAENSLCASFGIAIQERVIKAVYRDVFPVPFRLPIKPCLEVESVIVGGESVEFTTEGVQDVFVMPKRFAPYVEITFRAGYGAVGYEASIPADLTQAIMQFVSEMYRLRGQNEPDAPSVVLRGNVPATVMVYMRKYKNYAL